MSFRSERNVQSVNQGFTIIEVLIVLAIAALIITMIFLVVPVANRNNRNYSRKHTVQYVVGQMGQYLSDTGHPLVTLADGNTFVDTYLADVATRPGSAAQKLYTVQFRDDTGSHSDIPPYDTIYVQYGHWCARHGGVDSPGDPIATAPGGDNDNHIFVVWTLLEPSTVFCYDNG